jgi:hypothetical protein
LSQLAPRDRQVAEALVVGESTTDVAGHFGVTPGRIAQLRRELCESWSAFHGETEPARAWSLAVPA